MMAAVLIIALVFMVYQYIGCINASDSANKAAEELASAMTKTFAGPEGISSAYKLPDRINNHPYNLTISNNGRSILITVYGTKCERSAGGAPLSFDVKGYMTPVKNESEEGVTIILVHENGGMIVGRKDTCSSCIVLEEMHYDSSGNDCENPQDEYAELKNNCTVPFQLAGWTLRDAKNHIYTLPDYLLGPSQTVRIHTGCGADVTGDLYWCNQKGPCKAVWNNGGDELSLDDAKNETCIDHRY